MSTTAGGYPGPQDGYTETPLPPPARPPLRAIDDEFTQQAEEFRDLKFKDKEYVLAAKRAGVHDVILPADNKTNVEEDLTPEQLLGLTPHYVKTIDEVLEIALPTSPREELQDAEEREKVLST